MKREAPVLITWDVDPLSRKERVRIGLDPHKEESELLNQSLDAAVRVVDDAGIDCTFFFTATVAEMVKEKVRELRGTGQEIGCHGYDHSEVFDYSREGEGEQRKRLLKATEIISEVAGERPLAFRSPRLKISSSTVQILEELGYLTDSSVSSQRIDLLSSNPFNPHWVVAPRGPYHPARNNPYARGTLKLWEVPITAMILPFLSGTMGVLGKRTMRSFFRFLLREGRKTGRPLVYLVHPHELIASEAYRKIPREWRKPSKEWFRTGIPLRFDFFKFSRKTEKDHIDFFKYMRSQDGVRFMTMRQLISRLEEQK